MELSGKNVAIGFVFLLCLVAIGILIWYFAFFKSKNGCSVADQNSCGDNQWCDFSAGSDDGVCKKCEGCDNCDFSTGICMGSECELGDDSCGENKWCDNGNCKDCPCNKDPNQPQQAQCDLWTGECMDAACTLENNICGDNEYCDTETGFCLDCNCNEKQQAQCDSLGNCKCKTGINSCDTNQWCNAGTCTDCNCNPDTEDPQCDLNTGSCTQKEE